MAVERILKLGTVMLIPVSEMPAAGRKLERANRVGFVDGFVIDPSSASAGHFERMGYLAIGRRRTDGLLDYAWFTEGARGSRFVRYDLIEALEQIFDGRMPYRTTDEEVEALKKYEQKLLADHRAD